MTKFVPFPQFESYVNFPLESHFLLNNIRDLFLEKAIFFIDLLIDLVCLSLGCPIIVSIHFSYYFSLIPTVSLIAINILRYVLMLFDYIYHISKLSTLTTLLTS